MKKRAVPKPRPPRYRIHEWYALVGIFDAAQGGFIWHRQCPHAEISKAMQDARKRVNRWLDDPQLFPTPLDDAFHHKQTQNNQAVPPAER